MSDGAHLFVGVDDSMRAIIGGKKDITPRTEEDFEAYVRAMPRDGVIDGQRTYESTGTATARLILEAYEKFPVLRQLPDRHEYLEPGNWSNPIYLNVTLTDVIYKLYPDIDNFGLSGFQWGWAVNAARAILKLGPLPNPAILEIKVPTWTDEQL